MTSLNEQVSHSEDHTGRLSLCDHTNGGPTWTRLKGAGRKRFTNISFPKPAHVSDTPPCHGGIHIHTSTSISTSPKAAERIRRITTIIDERPSKKARECHIDKLDFNKDVPADHDDFENFQAYPLDAEDEGLDGSSLHNGTHAKRIQTAEELMRDFVGGSLALIQNAILSRWASESVDDLCNCGRGKSRIYRCVDCDTNDIMCELCLLDRHQHSLFHWAEKWNGSFFEQYEMSKLGLRIFLGHGGKCCPRTLPTSLIRIRVVDINGIHNSSVVYCECPGRMENYLQLIAHGLFPASVKLPSLAFTMRCLSDFHTHTHASRKSAFDYMKALRRKTDHIDPIRVKTPTAQFMRVERLWRLLAAERNSGQTFSIDEKIAFRPAGSFAEVCLACPTPGLNNFTSGRPDKPHLDTLFLCADGNFKLINLEKNNNLNDAALWDGKGYFCAKDVLDAHMEKFRNIVVEKGTCREFTAIENCNSLKYDKQAVSGVVMVLCRHGCVRPGAAVNLKRGEQFSLIDRALFGALQNTEQIRRKVLAYDIGCQYCVNLRARFAQQFPDMQIDDLIVLVGKMHVHNHVDECKWRRSFNYTSGVGRMDGEAAERFWAEMNQLAGSTKQMNPGHRNDILDDSISDWNRRKMQNLPRAIEYTLKKIARPTAKQTALRFQDADRSMRERYGDAVVQAWEAMDTEPFLNESGEWDSVYRSKNPAPCFAEALKEVSHVAMGDATTRIDFSSSSFLVEGLRIHRLQREIRSRSLKEEELKLRKARLRPLVQTWYREYLLTLPTLHCTTQQPNPDSEVEWLPLFLPSEFSTTERVNYGLEDVSKVELILRRGEACDAIQSLKTAIRSISALEYDADKYTRNRNTNTRSGEKMRAARESKRFWMKEYQAIREAMLRLGMLDSDPNFPRLTEEDTYRPSTLSYHEFGSGGSLVGWIWTVMTGRLPVTNNVRQDYEQEDDRVQWFRQRAAMKSWADEVEILSVDLERTVDSCENLAVVWSNIQGSEKAGRAAFAAQKCSEYTSYAKEAQTRRLRLDIEI